jgi:hypothetical protein
MDGRWEMGHWEGGIDLGRDAVRALFTSHQIKLISPSPQNPTKLHQWQWAPVRSRTPEPSRPPDLFHLKPRTVSGPATHTHDEGRQMPAVRTEKGKGKMSIEAERPRRHNTNFSQDYFSLLPSRREVGP